MNPNPGTAIPKWLYELLPPFFTSRPELIEALYTFALAIHRYSYPIYAALYGVALTQHYGDIFGSHSFFVWLWTNLNGLLLGYVFGGAAAGVQARSAGLKAKAAVEDAAQDPPQA